MTAEEIRSFDVTQEGAANLLLREVAAQLADANEAQRVRAAKADEQIAEAKTKWAAKAGFYDQLTEEFTPLIPKMRAAFERLFDPPAFDSPVAPPFASIHAVAVPSTPEEADALVLDYLRSCGHDEEKAKQILHNHRGAVLTEMFQAGAGRPAPQVEVANGEKEKDSAPQQEGAVPQTP